MTVPAHSRRKSKFTLRTALLGAQATSAMIASLHAEGRGTVAAPFGMR